MKKATEIEKINQVALALKDKVTVKGVNRITIAPEAKDTYEELITLLEIPALQKAQQYIAHTSYNLDVNEFYSIALTEGVCKAFATWFGDITFYPLYVKSLSYVFNNYHRVMTANKRFALTSAVSVYQLRRGEEVCIFDFIEDTKADLEKIVLNKELLSKLANLTDEDDLKVISVLMNCKGKDKGQAFAKAFGKDTYDASLRKKVERIRKRIASLVTND